LRDMGTIDDSTLRDLLEKQKNKGGAVFGQIALEEKAVRKEDLGRALQEQSRSRNTASFVRVSSSRLTALVDMVGELVVNQSMIRQKLVQGGESLSENDINQLVEVTSSLKDLVLSMGMISLRDMFQKLRVVVRNASRDLNKIVTFDITGEDTEIDRSLVEAIYDPLVHMVRNSVSHGIESASTRAGAGKPEVGRISISAEYRGNGVEISVRDDGRGIDPEKIVDKAISLGWLDRAKRSSYVKDEAFVYSLLYRPGFSTKDEADSISGRGVGMDVVMQNITRINGKVEIQSELGKGSLFRIKLPLTLAIIDGFVTDIMGESYVIPFESVEEILVNTELNIVPSEGDDLMGESRGKYFPVVDVYKILTGEPGFYQGNYVYVLINHDDSEFAIPVNRVLGKQEIVIKNLNEITRRQKLFYGGTIFGDGSIGFILDMEEILSFYKLSDTNQPLSGCPEEQNEK
ncbi:MAG: chemotaxis protein CheW, partial [Spirochaetales bacterium]|nr:chemotaxis protein CheW [Spirochaetales bacterium]